MKRILTLTLAAVVLVAVAAQAAKIKTTIKQGKTPQTAAVHVTELDCTTAGTNDVSLPDNLTYVVDAVYVYSELVTSLSTGATFVVTEVDSTNGAVQTIVASTTITNADTTANWYSLTVANTNAISGANKIRIVNTVGLATADTKRVYFRLSTL